MIALVVAASEALVTLVGGLAPELGLGRIML